MMEKFPLREKNIDESHLHYYPLTEETRCGFGGHFSFLQKYANKKIYVFLYGLVGLLFSASFTYFNGIITTIEKRFRIRSETIGLISIGNNIVQVLTSVIISYYAARGHRPRWMAAGICAVGVQCLLEALPHLIYGPGEDAISLTNKQRGSVNFHVDSEDELCRRGEQEGVHCEQENENAHLMPIIILFVAKCISGLGSPLYYTIGIAYIDDNVKKSNTANLISISTFINMLGPALGYALSSFCLRQFITPSIAPSVSLKDPNWLGAWWLGWIILAIFLFIIGGLMALFPKTLPESAFRKMISEEKDEVTVSNNTNQVSFLDLLKTLKRLSRNPIFMFNVFSNVCYHIGWSPYSTFMPKYIETQYRISSSMASFYTGMIGLGFSALGVLLAGWLITKYKPGARKLAAWNVLVSLISVFGLFSYIFLGCSQTESDILMKNNRWEMYQECNTDCHCDYVKYNPVCSTDTQQKTTHSFFISACHAGCTQFEFVNEVKHFHNCSCVHVEGRGGSFGTVTEEFCSNNCTFQFYWFLFIFCVIQFINSAGMPSDFLISARCIEEKDKSVSFALGLTINCFLAFLPSPILFGHLIDSTCLVWGKTCSSIGNCWLYNNFHLRSLFNITASGFILIGAFLDIGVWYYVKELNIFDEINSNNKNEIEMTEKEYNKGTE